MAGLEMNNCTGELHLLAGTQSGRERGLDRLPTFERVFPSRSR